MGKPGAPPPTGLVCDPAWLVSWAAALSPGPAGRATGAAAAAKAGGARPATGAPPSTRSSRTRKPGVNVLVSGAIGSMPCAPRSSGGVYAAGTNRCTFGFLGPSCNPAPPHPDAPNSTAPTAQTSAIAEERSLALGRAPCQSPRQHAGLRSVHDCRYCLCPRVAACLGVAALASPSMLRWRPPADPVARPWGRCAGAPSQPPHPLLCASASSPRTRAV